MVELVANFVSLNFKVKLTHRLIGGKHQVWNHTSSKAKKDDETHCFSFFLAVVNKFFTSKRLKERKQALHVTYRDSSMKRWSKKDLTVQISKQFG